MKKDFKKKVVLAVILPCLVLLALPFFVDNADEALRSVTKIFAGEKSYVKTILLLVYLATLGVVSCLCVRHKKEGTKPARKYGLFLAVSLAISYLINVGSFVWFFCRYKFPLSEFVITMNSGDMSSGQLVHNHVMKGIVGMFAQFYNNGVYETVDAGVAFVGLLPHAVFIAGAISFLTTLVAFILYFRQRLTEHFPTEKAKPVLFLFLYGIASFVLLKNIIDGGLFDFAVLPSLYFIFLLSGHKSILSRNLFAIGSLVYVAIVSAFAFMTAQGGSLGPLVYFYRSIVVFSVLFVLYFILKSHADRRLRGLLVLGVLSLVWYPIQSNLGILKYENAVITQDEGAVIGLYAAPTSSSYVELGRVGELAFYKYTPTTTHMSIGELLEENSLVNNFYPISIPWSTCVPIDGAQDYTFSVKSLQEMSLEGNALVNLLKFEAKSSEDGFYSYEISLRTNGCMPRGLDVINEFFSSQGAKTFFIYDISTGQYVYDLQ